MSDSPELSTPESPTTDHTEYTKFQMDVLRAVIRESDRSGQDIKEDLAAHYTSPVNHGRLYPNLDDLIRRGLAEKGQLDRRTNSYEPTDAGIATLTAYVNWLIEGLIQTGKVEGDTLALADDVDTHGLTIDNHDVEDDILDDPVTDVQQLNAD